MKTKALLPFMLALTAIVLLGCPTPITPPTDTVINISAIAGVTAPVAGATPVTTISDTDQYTGTVTWSGSPTSFAASTVYTATITLTAKTGYTLTGVAANFFTVAGATSVTNSASTGTVTAVFPSTAAEPDTVINIAAIAGVTAPVAGATPVTTITETAQYSGTVSWSPAVSNMFVSNTVYTATITLTAKTGYTLTGVAANFFTVTGASSVVNSASSGTVTAVFPSTAAEPDTVINIAAIAGVTAPVAGATPVTTISDTDQYTGTVTWSGTPTTFAYSTSYTATITLTAKTGYTLSGVTANFFTVTGASSVANTASSGTVTAVFPSTAAEPMYKTYVVNEETLFSTGLPVVSIITENHTKIESKENWIPATMKITNATDESWNFDEIDISIRGRGNTTWGQAKKPFAIKLSKKQKICGMPKHKRWVLIANYLDNSFMKNTTAFYLSKKLGMDYTVRGEYVNLVLNGNYVGLYWLGEAIKVDENRVNIDEENDFLVEMDVYYDETWKFKSEIKNLPYMIKNDEFMTEEKLSTLKDRISEMEGVLYSENFPYKNENNVEIDTSYSDYIDLTSFAQFYLVNEIMYNGELGHPKSCYFTFESDTGILSAGPVWDFDWAACSSAQSFRVKNKIYYDSLFKIPAFNERTKELVALIDINDVSSEIESMRTKISKSVELDGKRWGTGNRNPVGEKRNSFDEYVDYLKDCTISRINFVKNEF